MPVTADSRELIERILQGPLGCMALIIARDQRLAPEQAANYVTACHLAAAAGSELNPYVPRTPEWRERALAARHGLRPYAERLADVPAFRDWWADLDRPSQVWVSWGDRDDFPEDAMPGHAADDAGDDAGRVVRVLDTSTRRDGTSSWEIGMQWRLSWFIWGSGRDVTCRDVSVAPDARIHEVHAPEDWAELVARFPTPLPWERPPSAAERRGGPRSPVNWLQQRIDSPQTEWYRVEPDLRAARSSIDGIHVSLGGLLACEHVMVPFGEGGRYARLHWGTEHCRMLRWRFSRVGPAYREALPEALPWSPRDLPFTRMEWRATGE